MTNVFWMAGLIGFVLVSVSMLVQMELSTLTPLGDRHDPHFD
jgi:hypothetical protein